MSTQSLHIKFRNEWMWSRINASALFDSLLPYLSSYIKLFFTLIYVRKLKRQLGGIAKQLFVCHCKKNNFTMVYLCAGGHVVSTRISKLIKNALSWTIYSFLQKITIQWSYPQNIRIQASGLILRLRVRVTVGGFLIRFTAECLKLWINPMISVPNS